MRGPAVEQIIEAIQRAWYGGRPIVPIVGAGLSADSGIPIIGSIVRYFAKLQQFLEHRAFLPPGGADEIPALTQWAEECRRNPWKFVAAFGWPDRFDLNLDLLLRLAELRERPDGGWARDCAPRDLIDRAVDRGLDAVLDQINPQGKRTLRALEQAVLDDHRLRGLTPDQREQLRLHFSARDGRYVPFDLIGDWKRLIQFFTNYQGDLADGLFVKLCENRAPSHGHRFLAFLVKLLGVRRILTFNFDNFIEAALEGEGISPRVFAMEEGRGLPHNMLVQDTVSVIKLHGSNHALLVDERLDHPLTDEYKRRFDRLAGSDPLLLVVGCSGGDHRLRDLVSHVVRRAAEGRRDAADREATGGRPGPDGPAVIWLHFGPDVPEFLTALKGEKAVGERAVLSGQTNHPGAALQHIYSALTSRHPVSTVPYASHVQRPLPFPAAGGGPAGVGAEWPSEPFVLYVPPPVPDEEYPSTNAAEHLIGLADLGVRRGYHVVWVDLESVHTLAAVVGNLIDQCRRFDPSLAPSVLPLHDPDPGVLETACTRVQHALRRGRYLVLLEGLDAYQWPPTSHHGESRSNPDTAGRRLNVLADFLVELTRRDIGNSRVAVSAEQPKNDVPRHPGSRRERAKQIQAVVKRVRAAYHPVAIAPTSRPYADRFRFPRPRAYLTTPVGPAVRRGPAGERPRPEQWALALQYLACFRRARPLAALRHLLLPIFGSRPRVDAAVRALTARGGEYGLVRLEGGSVWFHRPVRDEVYDRNSQHVERGRIVACLTGAAPRDEFKATVGQLFLLAAAQQRVARFYYTFTYVQAQDTTAFLEYTYHRVSSIRNVCRLLAVVRAADAAGDGRRGWVRDTLRECGEILVRGSADPRMRDALFRRMELGEALTAALLGQWPAAARPGDLRPVIDELEGRHVREVRSLTRAWTRAEPQLRSQQPAEQLIYWCDSVLREDVDLRCNHILLATAPGGSGPIDSRRQFFAIGAGPDAYAVNPRAAAALRAFRTQLSHFKVRLKIDRTDYEAAVLDRLAMIREDLAPHTPTRAVAAFGWAADEVRVYAPEAYRVAHLHYLLDVALCFIKRRQEPGPEVVSAAEVEKLLRFIGDRLAALRDPVRALEDGPPRPGGTLPAAFRDYPLEELTTAASDFNEAELRVEHMWLEFRLGSGTVFGRGFTGDRIDRREAAFVHDEATDRVNRGLTGVRSQTFRPEGALRSVILEPTPDGSVYLQYRSNFHTHQGRLDWLSCFGRDGRLEADRVGAGFESAYRNFDLARGGLGGTNRLLAALNEMAMVEACLANARIILHPDYFGARDGGSAPDPLRAAFAKYEAARSALQRAREALLAGRRNVVWWKQFFSLVAQYHADRLLLGYAQLVDDWVGADGDLDRLTRRTRPAEFLLRLRRGYAALRSGLDYRLQGRDEGAAGTSPWLSRTWCEMTLCGYVAGLWLYDVYSRSPVGRRGGSPGERPPAPGGDRPAYVVAMIRLQNLSARLLETADPGRPGAAGDTPFSAWCRAALEDLPRWCAGLGPDRGRAGAGTRAAAPGRPDARRQRLQLIKRAERHTCPLPGV